jgi:non-heme chloroperoxidase
MTTRIKLLSGFLAVVGILLAAVLGALGFGGPPPIAPMAAISNPFRSLDFSALPASKFVTARDGLALAYREYGKLGKGSVVLVHGSSGSGSGVHHLAQALAQAGYKIYTLDIRGHGASTSAAAPKGHVAYIGQLEHDLEDFMRAATPAQPVTLSGFSSGGGFALRVAASGYSSMFNHTLLLAPYVSHLAPTYRPNSGGWVSVGYPRIAAIVALNMAGVRAGNHLPVLRFAVQPESKAYLTETYDFNTMMNFASHRDYRATIAAVKQPMAVLVGSVDESFFSEHFAPVFQSVNRSIEVTQVQGIGHIGLTLEPRAHEVIINTLNKWHQ